MLAVSGMSVAELQDQIDKTMKGIRTQEAASATQSTVKGASKSPADLSLSISIINETKAIVVSGASSSLLRLVDDVTKASAPAGSQSRVPFSLRKPETRCIFLPVSSPFHSISNQRVSEDVKKDWERLLSNMSPRFLAPAFPVLSTVDGAVIPVEGSVTTLVDIQCALVADWPKLASKILDLSTRVMEFGPSSGAAKLLATGRTGGGLTIIASRVSSTFVPRIARADCVSGVVSIDDYLENA